MKLRLVPGMLGEGRGRNRVLWKEQGDTWAEIGLVPDLHDRATFLLAKDQLAERVGLDPAGGVLWDRMQSGRWMLLDTRGRSRSFYGIDTDDPIAALRAALEATEEVKDG